MVLIVVGLHPIWKKKKLIEATEPVSTIVEFIAIGILR